MDRRLSDLGLPTVVCHEPAGVAASLALTEEPAVDADGAVNLLDLTIVQTCLAAAIASAPRAVAAARPDA